MQGCPVEPSMLMAEHLISAKSALDLAEYRSTDTDPELLTSDSGTVMVLLKNRDKSIRMRILFHQFIQHQIEHSGPLITAMMARWYLSRCEVCVQVKMTPPVHLMRHSSAASSPSSISITWLLLVTQLGESEIHSFKVLVVINSNFIFLFGKVCGTEEC